MISTSAAIMPTMMTEMNSGSMDADCSKERPRVRYFTGDIFQLPTSADLEQVSKITRGWWHRCMRNATLLVVVAAVLLFVWILVEWNQYENKYEWATVKRTDNSCLPQNLHLQHNAEDCNEANSFLSKGFALRFIYNAWNHGWAVGKAVVTEWSSFIYFCIIAGLAYVIWQTGHQATQFASNSALYLHPVRVDRNSKSSRAV